MHNNITQKGEVVMKKVTKAVKYRINLEDFAKRRRYLERIAGDINNTLLEEELSPSERSKLYSNLLNAIQSIQTGQRDALLEEISERLKKVESRRN